MWQILWYNIHVMDFEEREKQRRRQVIKVIIAEIGMTVSVIAIVVVATLASMGFFVTSSGKIEQSGLIQIHSMPTGATAELDGSVLFSKTNLSRTLTPGEHSLKLSRDGYDSWQKSIKMSSGMLVRLYYPRLFLLNRKAEVALRLGEDLEFYLPSNDQTYVLYATRDSAQWNLINIKDDEPKVTRVDVSAILPGVQEGKFLGNVEAMRWNNNSDSVLTKVSYDGKAEWILINLKDAKQSLNLTRAFGLEFVQVEIIDDAAGQLFALENHQLRKINTSDQSISRVLLNNIESFANNKTNVVYVMQNTVKAGEQPTKVIGVYRDGERGGTVLMTVANDVTTHVALTRYYDEDYIIYTVGNEMNVLYGAVPTYRENVQETDFSGLKVLLNKTRLAAVPKQAALSPEGEYLVAQDGRQFMVVDFEMGELIEYEADEANYNWTSEGMMAVVTDGALKVWDFDYTNQRVLVKYVSEGDMEAELDPVTTKSNVVLTQYPTVISDNNRYIYYVVQTKTGLALMRERIRD